MDNDLFISFFIDGKIINNDIKSENREIIKDNANKIIISTVSTSNDETIKLNYHHIILLNNIFHNKSFTYNIELDDGDIQNIEIYINGNRRKTIIKSICKSQSNDEITDILKNKYVDLTNKLFFKLCQEINLINFINYFQVFLVDAIINLPPHIMFAYIREKYYSENKKIYSNDKLQLDREPITNFHKFNLYELLGCYIHTNGYIENIDLYDILKKYGLMNNKKIILICDSKINELKEDLSKSIEIDKLLSKNIYDMVFAHEIGHYTFDYNLKGLSKLPYVSSSFKEKQANYFLSHLYSGYIDDLIIRLTSIQPSIYHNPVLFSNECKSLINVKKSNCYNLYIFDEGKLK